jgi:prepilin-type N-terminal cleavage/methylation domain-containing protein
MFKNSKGFTMIELVVVLVLIGLIVAIAVPKYLDVTTSAKEKSLRESIAAMRGSVPDDVYTPTNNVDYQSPITTFNDTGGWIYDKVEGIITMGVIRPRLQNFQEAIAVNAAIRQLTLDLNIARNLSLKSNFIYKVVFSFGTDVYSTYHEDPISDLPQSSLDLAIVATKSISI